MNTIEIKLLINGVRLHIGDKVVVNKVVVNEDSVEKIRCESIFRGYDVSDRYIRLWFSANNFLGKSFRDENYDVITRMVRFDNINNDIKDMNIEIIK